MLPFGKSKFKFTTSCAPDGRLVDLLWCPSASQSLASGTSSFWSGDEDQRRLLPRYAPVTAAVARDAPSQGRF